MSIKQRSEVPVAFTWDLTGLYADDTAWEAEFESMNGLAVPIMALQGTLNDSAETLVRCLTLDDELSRVIGRLFTYASRRADEDTANTTYMGMLDRMRKRANEISSSLSWIRPEILAIPDELMETFLASAPLGPWSRAMDQILRTKPHTLSEKEERLLAMAGEPLGSSARTFGLLNNADIRFPTVTDDKGEDVEITHGNYVQFLESRDRAVRKRAFQAYHATYEGFKNTLASTLSSTVATHVFNAKARDHGSAIEASLFNDNVCVDVYDSLIDAVHTSIPTLQRYLALRKRVLKLSDLDMYDLYVPLVADYELTVPFDQAFDWVLEAVSPLGDDYVSAMAKAKSDRWIDVYENRGKRSGAYSGGCYDGNPFILLNYQDNLNSVFTLAHELGHSMHTLLSNANQPHRYARYKIFVAEVASTLNEALLFEHLMKTSDDPKLKAYLLNQKCEGFKGTVFRQSMFAEFEKAIHAKAEANVPLTPDELSSTYLDLNKAYYSPEVTEDPLIAMEWSRIPHFYYDFYVYKYATGFSAAELFAQRILAGDLDARDRYLNFLSGGCSKDPLDLLADAGVDLRTPAVICDGLTAFGRYLDELEPLLLEL